MLPLKIDLHGCPAALRLAHHGPTPTGVVGQEAASAPAAASQYTAKKTSHLNTANLCAKQEAFACLTSCPNLQEPGTVGPVTSCFRFGERLSTNWWKCWLPRWGLTSPNAVSSCFGHAAELICFRLLPDMNFLPFLFAAFFLCRFPSRLCHLSWAFSFATLSLPLLIFLISWGCLRTV